MKENISIIFAALIGVFLVILLPLFSILDRQDSMAYNVVLTATTNFVDKIRTDGFIDGETYNNYIAEMASTGNTYKVSIKAYKKVLIKDTNEQGQVIQDSYVEQKELYNTNDILEQLEVDTSEKAEMSTRKNNVYLFNQDDEIYVSVENTNITTGSIIYNWLANASNNKVVDINYGGVINNINWELYEKIKNDAVIVPEVSMSVPVNMLNSTNIAQVNNNQMSIEGNYVYIDCNSEELPEELKEACEDSITQESPDYVYLYDLSNEINKQIRVAVELRGIDKIDIGNKEYENINTLSVEAFDDSNGQSNIEKYIIDNYIRTYGMYSPNIDIDLRVGDKRNYYIFDIYFNDVTMSSIDYISNKAVITILPGLGQDSKGTSSLGAETVEIELLDAKSVNTVKISSPYIWEKLLKTKSRTESVISTNSVYANEDIAFVISYTGISDYSDEQIKQALRQNLIIHSNNRQFDGLEIYTAEEFNEKYSIDLRTAIAGHIIVKFRYTEPNSSKENYLQLQDNWITTKKFVIDEQGEEVEVVNYVSGAVSSHYEVLADNSSPLPPSITLDGTRGTNGWYTSDVMLTVTPSYTDRGSGVARNTLKLEGATTFNEQEIKTYNLTLNGITKASVKAYDYVGNASSQNKETIKIDKQQPTQPKIIVESGKNGKDNWYTSDVSIRIIPGTDAVSGVQETTYKIQGAIETDEKTGRTYTLRESGKSTVIATTYDKAGNKSETKLELNIDKETPADAKISVISGEKRQDSDWYYTDVKLKVTVSSGEAASGLGKASYRIGGSSGLSEEISFSGNETEITIDQNGIYELYVYTYTAAGQIKTTRYSVKIDKDEPKAPTVEVTRGTEGDNGWYKSDVNVRITSNGDNGHSNVNQIKYTITSNGETSEERDIPRNNMISFKEEGEHILRVYSRDNALNENVFEKVIKIDKTQPVSAQFDISGTLGENGWYTSDVNISYKGAQDDVSGISEITLSLGAITEDTNAQQVILTTRDNAGHEVVKTTVIKVDKTQPKQPKLDILTEQTGDGPIGVMYYNKDVNIKLTPGIDYPIDGIDNTNKTIYTIKGPDNYETITENILTEKNIWIREEGKYNITITTYDMAGNKSYATQNIWINKQKPATPSIVKINGEVVENLTKMTITSSSSVINLDIKNLTQGNELTINLLNEATSRIEKEIIVYDNTKNIEVNLKEKGEYRIYLTQTNMFGTTSNISSGMYYYKYE